MNDIVIRAITKLQKDKKEANTVPNHVSQIDIEKLINSGVKITLNKLVEEGKIKRVETMHGYHYTIIG